MKIFRNLKGAGTVGSAGAIIGLVLALYVMAYTLPDAIGDLSSETGYEIVSDAVVNIATVVLPIMVMFACILILLPTEVKTKIGLWYEPKISAFKTNLKGASQMGSAGAIIGIVLAVYVMANTLPDALNATACATSYGDASSAVVNIGTVVLPIMVIFACVLYILPQEVKGKIGF